MKPASRITFDESHWPLLIIRYEGSPTLEQYDTYLRERTRYLLRGEPHVTLSDARTTRLCSLEYRHHFAGWMRENTYLLEQTVLGTALVLGSSFLRLMVSTLLPLRPQSIPYSLAATPEAGALWCAERLEEEGLTGPAGHIREQFAIHRLRASG
jgi:hypothetical protein